MVEFKKMNKKQLKNFISQYKQDLEKELNWVKTFKVSKMLKKQLVEVCLEIQNKNMDDNIEDEKKEQVQDEENEV